MSDRKQLPLRLEPELHARLQRAVESTRPRATMTAWVVDAIERRLEEIEGGKEDRPATPRPEVPPPAPPARRPAVRPPAEPVQPQSARPPGSPEPPQQPRSVQGAAARPADKGSEVEEDEDDEKQAWTSVDFEAKDPISRVSIVRGDGTKVPIRNFSTTVTPEGQRVTFPPVMLGLRDRIEIA